MIPTIGAGPGNPPNGLRFHAPLALLPGGWADDVTLEATPSGMLSRVESGAGEAVEGSSAVPLDGIVVPGIPNVHSHAFQRALAGLTESPPARPAGIDGAANTFWHWRETLYHFIRRLTPDDIHTVASFAYMEMLRAGTTSVSEFHYLHRDPEGGPYPERGELSHRVIDAALRSGIGITHLPVLYSHGGFGGTPPEPEQRPFVLPPDELVELVASLRARHGDDPRVRIGLAFHSLRAVALEDLLHVLDEVRADDPGVPVHIHVAEQVKEVEDCVAWSGFRPVEFLLAHAPVGASWCLVHATHVSSQEVDALAERGSVVGLCPTTEANLGDGIFPLPRLLAAGGRFGVGSDSQVSVNPVEELRLLEYGQRLARRERNVAGRSGGGPTGTVLFEGAVEGARQASGRPVGILRAGERADFLVLDPEHPDFQGRPPEQILDSWIFAGQRSPVRDVYVGGERIVRDGRHHDEEAITSEYRECLNRIASPS